MDTEVKQQRQRSTSRDNEKRKGKGKRSHSKGKRDHSKGKRSHSKGKRSHSKGKRDHSKGKRNNSRSRSHKRGDGKFKGMCKGPMKKFFKDYKSELITGALAQDGLTQANQQLVDQGFHKVGLNYLLLKKYGGDVQKVVQEIQSLRTKVKGIKHQGFDQELEKLGYIQQNQQLLEMGFTKPKKNLKVLTKTNGNLDLAVQVLTKKGKKEPETVDPETEAKLKQLEELGFEKRKKNLKRLIFHEGDVQKVIDDYVRKADRQKKRDHLEKITKENIINNLQDPRLRDSDSIYIDGNNLFYVTKEIRDLCLNRQGLKAELRLKELLVEALRPFNFKLIYLIFDRTVQVYEQEVFIIPHPQNLKVVSASPQFNSSDDALVEIARGLQDKSRSVFVTSDRELLRRLNDQGITKVMKSKLLFKQPEQQQAQA